MLCHYRHIKTTDVSLIDSFFEMKSCQKEARRDFIIPDGTPGIMYVEQGSFRRTHRFGSDLFSAGDLVLFGQKTRAVSYQLHQHSTQARGFKLMPYSLFELFGISADSLTDDFLLITDTGMKAKMLYYLWLETLPKSRATLNSQLHEIACLINLINDSKGSIPVSDLFKKLNRNYKYIERLFKKHVGLTPKLYARIIRFNYGFKLLHQSRYKLTDIGFQCGYFDQNHFIKEIKSFTQLTPKELFDFDSSGVQENHIQYLRQRTF